MNRDILILSASSTWAPLYYYGIFIIRAAPLYSVCFPNYGPQFSTSKCFFFFFSLIWVHTFSLGASILEPLLIFKTMLPLLPYNIALHWSKLKSAWIYCIERTGLWSPTAIVLDNCHWFLFWMSILSYFVPLITNRYLKSGNKNYLLIWEFVDLFVWSYEFRRNCYCQSDWWSTSKFLPAWFVI